MRIALLRQASTGYLVIKLFFLKKKVSYQEGHLIFCFVNTLMQNDLYHVVGMMRYLKIFRFFVHESAFLCKTLYIFSLYFGRI